MNGIATTRRRRPARVYRGPARSCEQCFAWGVLRGRLCRGCEGFTTKYPIGSCRTCQRPDVAIHDDVCRLCRKQATLMTAPNNKQAVDLTIAATTGQQLFLANIPRSPRRTHHTAPTPVPQRAVITVPDRRPEWTQGLLCDPARDCRHVNSLDPPRDPGFLDLTLRHAEQLAEHHGWPPRTLEQVRRGLRMLAVCHHPGEPIKASTVTALSQGEVPGLRVLEVLTAAGDGRVVDDRPDSLSVWIDAQFDTLPPQIRQELQAWIDVLRDGTPRRRARPRNTVFAQLSSVRPFLLECTTRYHTLRQVTRDDVLDWLDGRKHRANDASALRDLFRTLKAARLVFTNPTYRVHVSRANQTMPRPLDPQSLRQLGRAAEQDPALRVVLALIGVHALFPHQVRQLLLDQVDLPNRRLGIHGADRALDEFTAEAITAYLDYRHDRWPHTSNPHLLLTRRTAHEHGPVSEYWLTTLFCGLPATATQLREDRILEEARATAGDPLHLAAMFGLGGQAGLRYAHAVHPELPTQL